MKKTLLLHFLSWLFASVFLCTQCADDSSAQADQEKYPGLYDYETFVAQENICAQFEKQINTKMGKLQSPAELFEEEIRTLDDRYRDKYAVTAGLELVDKPSQHSVGSQLIQMNTPWGIKKFPEKASDGKLLNWEFSHLNALLKVTCDGKRYVGWRALSPNESSLTHHYVTGLNNKKLPKVKLVEVEKAPPAAVTSTAYATMRARYEKEKEPTEHKKDTSQG